MILFLIKYDNNRSGTRFIKQDTSDDQYKVISVSYDNESFVKNNYASKDKIESDLYRDWKQEPLKILPKSLKHSTNIRGVEEGFTNYMPIKK